MNATEPECPADRQAGKRAAGPTTCQNGDATEDRGAAASVIGECPIHGGPFTAKWASGSFRTCVSVHNLCFRTQRPSAPLKSEHGKLNANNGDLQTNARHGEPKTPTFPNKKPREDCISAGPGMFMVRKAKHCGFGTATSGVRHLRRHRRRTASSDRRHRRRHHRGGRGLRVAALR